MMRPRSLPSVVAICRTPSSTGATLTHSTLLEALRTNFGVTHRDLARLLGVRPGNRGLHALLDDLISDAKVVRGGAKNTGFRYWLGY